MSSSVNQGPAVTSTPNSTLATVGNGALLVSTSRSLLDSDNGLTLECTAAVTLTIPAGLNNFGCAIIPFGTLTISSDGTSLINGATASLSRAAAINPIIAVQPRSSAANSYVVTGS